MSVDVRVLSPDDLLTAWAVLERSFGSAVHPEDADVELAVVDPTRFYAVHADGRMVATAGSFAFSVAVPGAVLPVAGVTWVGVLPTYRRRGLLGALMSRQLTDLYEGGTSLAALWASEAAIYGRYGYGPAAWNLSVTLARGAAFRRPLLEGSLALVEPDATEPSWTDGVPAGVVRVREVVAEDAGATARLWRHLLDLDLTAEVQARVVAPDDPLLLSVLADPRRARAQLRDSLWVRLVDLPEALRSRRYACPVDVVLDMTDERAPWNTGRWRLTGDRSSATCSRTQAAGDLVLGPDDLGAAYLGGTPLRARPVEERTPGALDATSTAFGPLGPAPWCPMVF